MADEEWFSPWVIDRANGSQVSGPDLGHWGEQSIIDPAWDALHSSKNAAEFYRAAAFLVFHARHLDPTEHASLAKLLREPFKLRRGGQDQSERNQEIMSALAASGRLAVHEWQHLPRLQMIEAIRARWRMTPDAARKAYDKAKREMREQEAAERARREAEPPLSEEDRKTIDDSFP